MKKTIARILKSAADRLHHASRLLEKASGELDPNICRCGRPAGRADFCSAKCGAEWLTACKRERERYGAVPS